MQRYVPDPTLHTNARITSGRAATTIALLACMLFTAAAAWADSCRLLPSFGIVIGGDPTPITLSFDIEASPQGVGMWAPVLVTPGSPQPNPGTIEAGFRPWVELAEINFPGSGYGLTGPELVDFRVTLRDPMGAIVDQLFTSGLVGPHCEGLCGDCDQGGAIDILDALLVSQISVGVAMPPPAGQVECCDADQSGALTVIDALVLAQVAVGLTDTRDCPALEKCSIVSPRATTETGDVQVQLQTRYAPPRPATVTFEYSTDYGATYSLATPTAASPPPFDVNPTGLITIQKDLPPAFMWDTIGEGITTETVVDLRATIDDGSSVEVCHTMFKVFNGFTCFITSPATATRVCGDVSVGLDLYNPAGNQMIATFDFSTDFGISWIPATDAGTGTLTGSPAGPINPGSTDWTWDSEADLLGCHGMVFLRVTVADLVTMQVRTCIVIIDIRNAHIPPWREGAGPFPFWPPAVFSGDTTLPIFCGGLTTACGVGQSNGQAIIPVVPSITRTWTFSTCTATPSFDTILELREGSCDGPSVACNDNDCGLQSRLTSVPMTAGTKYYIVIDGQNGATGPWELRISTP